MKLKKGSKEAKEYMAKIRAKRASKKIGNDDDKYCIDYLNKSKGFAKDRVCFDTWKEAIEWGRKNLGNFHSDMINGFYKPKKKTAVKKVVKVGSTLKLNKKEMRLGMAPKTTSKSGNGYHKDTKSHNVNIKVVSGIGNVKPLSITQYLNQVEPQRNVLVKLKNSDVVKGAFLSYGYGKKIRFVQIKKLPSSTYVQIKGDTFLYTQDSQGNPKSKSVFLLPHV